VQKIVLVTGGAGFIGSHLTDKLSEGGYEVIVIDDFSGGTKKNLKSDPEIIRTAAGDPMVAEKLTGLEGGKISAAFHLATNTNIDSSLEKTTQQSAAEISNTLNFVQLCVTFGITRFVFASATHVYGPSISPLVTENDVGVPVNAYGTAKLACEHFLHNIELMSGGDIVTRSFFPISLRFANVYGPRQNATGEAGAIADICRSMVEGKPPVLYGNGKQAGDFIYIADAVSALVAAMNNRITGTCNISSASAVQSAAIYKSLKRTSKCELHPQYLPFPDVRQADGRYDNSKAAKILSWAPTINLKLGLASTFAWFEKSN